MTLEFSSVSTSLATVKILSEISLPLQARLKRNAKELCFNHYSFILLFRSKECPKKKRKKAKIIPKVSFQDFCILSLTTKSLIDYD